jgi:3-hydroxybutyryl-CoA dehydrogenase
VEAAADAAQAASGADLVLEAVAEDLEVKLAVLAAIEAAAPQHAVIATNTSSLDVRRLREGLRRRERFLGMHWFNPPEWTPGVEVVPVEETGTEAVERVTGLLRGIGKRPAVVRPGVGFVANRLQMALFSEAVRCVEDGIAEPAEVDEVVRSCFGFRLPFFGPFQIATMAGLDIYRAVLQQHRDGLGERFLGPEALDEGFYAYEDPDAVAAERDRRYAALAELLERFPPQSF